MDAPIQTNFKDRIKIAAKIALAFAIIIWMIRSEIFDPKSLKKAIDSSFVTTMLPITLIAVFLGSERWRLLLKAQKLSMRSFDVFRFSLIGLFFNFVIPGGVGGDVVKTFYLFKLHADKKVSSGLSILVDRVLGVYTLILTALLALFFNMELVFSRPQLTTVFYFVLFLFILASSLLGMGFFTSFFSVFLQEKISLHTKLMKFKFMQTAFVILKALRLFGHHPFILLRVLFLSFVSQILFIVIFILVGRSLHEEFIPWAVYFFVVPVGSILTAVPISPAGIGVGQIAFHSLFKFYLGYEVETGAIGITVLQLLQFIIGLLGAWFFLRIKKH